MALVKKAKIKKNLKKGRLKLRFGINKKKSETILKTDGKKTPEIKNPIFKDQTKRKKVKEKAKTKSNVSPKVKRNKKSKLKKAANVKLSNAQAANIASGTREKTETFLKKTKIRVIGIGGGGSSIISELSGKVRGAGFVAANMDFRSLKEVKNSILKFYFGQEITHGLGTGMNPDLGAEAAEMEKEKIKKLVEGQDLVIIISCLGGGTGSGASSVFGRIAKSSGCLTYGIFTLPFHFEGEKKMEIAQNGLLKIKGNFNAISIIPNDRVFEIIEKTTPLQHALSIINKMLSESIEGLIQTICYPGLINIDFADLKTIMSEGGKLAYLHSSLLPREEKNSHDFVRALSAPLLPYTAKGARGVLFNIVGEKGLTLTEVAQISSGISDQSSPDARIIFGVNQDASLKGKIRLTLLATGCVMKGFSVPAAPAKKTTETQVFEEQPREETKKEQKKPAKEIKPKKDFKGETKNLGKERKEEEEILSKPELAMASPAALEHKTETSNYGSETELKIRRNALQIHQDAAEQEKEILVKESAWDTPAFLRKRK